MKRHDLPPESDAPLFDLQESGKARTIYTIVAILVVISLVVGIAGFDVWDRLF